MPSHRDSKPVQIGVDSPSSLPEPSLMHTNGSDSSPTPTLVSISPAGSAGFRVDYIDLNVDSVNLHAGFASLHVRFGDREGLSALHLVQEFL